MFLFNCRKQQLYLHFWADLFWVGFVVWALQWLQVGV